MDDNCIWFEIKKMEETTKKLLRPITAQETLCYLNPSIQNEVYDGDLQDLLSIEPIHHASLFGFEDEGELPDDLTETEKILTDVIWGKRDATMAALLVAALENMDLLDVHHSMRRMGFII